jgi:hypothetical protein
MPKQDITTNMDGTITISGRNMCEGHELYDTQFEALYYEPRTMNGFEFNEETEPSLCASCFEDAVLEEIKNCYEKLDEAVSNLECFFIEKKRLEE